MCYTAVYLRLLVQRMNRFSSIGNAATRLVKDTGALFGALWRGYRGLSKKFQIGIAALLAVLVIAGFALAGGGAPAGDTSSLRAVSLRPLNELSGAGSGGNVLGTVHSIAEAKILAKTGGTVERVNTSLGASVPAGYVIASLENARERAAVLQAEGNYDSAVAARNATSLDEEVISAQNAYRSAYTNIDVTMENDIDLFFGAPTGIGPTLRITANGTDRNWLSRERAELSREMNTWQSNLEGAEDRNPQTLLDEAERVVRRVSDFLTRLADSANRRDAGTSPAQAAGLASARATVDSVLASLSAARGAFRSGEVGATASVDASVKTALGSLRAAQANLEQTVVRAPIGGTINFLPIQRGDYVTALTHVATVAQNNALEVVAYISEADREALSVGTKVFVEETHEGIVTAISPALDPVTKQVEIRIAIDASSNLTNGASVRVALPGAATSEVTQGPILLPLASVKLRADDRVVFTVNEEGRLAAILVETGAVRGGRIEITTALDPSLRIVADARGLAEGERVTIIEAP